MNTPSARRVARHLERSRMFTVCIDLDCVLVDPSPFFNAHRAEPFTHELLLTPPRTHDTETQKVVRAWCETGSWRAPIRRGVEPLLRELLADERVRVVVRVRRAMFAGQDQYTTTSAVHEWLERCTDLPVSDIARVEVEQICASSMRCHAFVCGSLESLREFHTAYPRARCFIVPGGGDPTAATRDTTRQAMYGYSKTPSPRSRITIVGLAGLRSEIQELLAAHDTQD